MSVFYKNVNLEILYKLLENNALKTNEYYLIDETAYRKIIFTKEHEPFINDVHLCYYPAKRIYTTRELTYRTFITILRQICKYHSIQFEMRTKYSHCNTEKIYFLYYKAHQMPAEET